MDVRTHWKKIYTTKALDHVSCYRPHLETSLALIKRSAVGPSSSVIDVGEPNTCSIQPWGASLL